MSLLFGREGRRALGELIKRRTDFGETPVGVEKGNCFVRVTSEFFTPQFALEALEGNPSARLLVGDEAINWRRT